MNIHDAVLQPIAAFVYCNRHAAAGRRRQTKGQKSEISTRQQAPVQLNSAHGRSLAKIIL